MERLSLGLAVVLLMLALARLGTIFQDVDLRLYDSLLPLRSVGAYQPPVSLITLDDTDLARLHETSLSDAELYSLLNRLAEYRPRAIGVDLYRDSALGPGTEQLVDLLSRHPEIIMAQKYGDKESPGIAPPPYLPPTSQAGCTDFATDSDNKVRRALVYLGNPVCYSMGYLLALRYLAPFGITARGDPEHPDILRFGQVSLPPLQKDDGGYNGVDASGYQILLSFGYPSARIPHYRIEEVTNNTLEPEHIRDKIILIGSMAESSKDFFATPLFFQQGIHPIPGLQLHALLADQLVRTTLLAERPLAITAEGWEWALLWICCFAGAFAGYRRCLLPIFLAMLGGGMVLLVAIACLSYYAGWWLPIAPCMLGWLLASFASAVLRANQEYRQRQNLMALFARHVGSPIADEIWLHRDKFLSGGKITPRQLTATIFFSDMQGFTTIAESLEPEVFIGWLNEYLDVMTAIIENHGGVVVRFIGDAIMAAFGVPVPREDCRLVAEDAERAAKCALAIQAELIRLNHEWSARNLPLAAMRIGINTGRLLAGSLGNAKRLEYTLHGDTVNIAARLESYQKGAPMADYFNTPCRILLSAETAGYLQHFNCVRLGLARFAGKQQEIEVFQLYDVPPDQES